MVKKKVKKRVSKRTSKSTRKKKKITNVKRTKTIKTSKNQIEKNIISIEKEALETLELQDPHHWKPFIISILIVFAVAFLGNGLIAKVVKSPWYESIKPAITPPTYMFSIGLNILFFLLATSMYLAWIHSKKGKKKIIAVEYGTNLFLILLWAFMFFGLKQPILSFFTLIFLLISIFSLIHVTWNLNKKASYFLIPYLLGASFVGVLNFLAII